MLPVTINSDIIIREDRFSNLGYKKRDRIVMAISIMDCAIINRLDTFTDKQLKTDIELRLRQLFTFHTA